MTEQNPAVFLQAGAHPAEDVRRALDSLLPNPGDEGIVAAGDLLVEENGTPNMSVDVAGGRAWIQGDEATYQGVYFVENRGVKNVVVSASDATNPRIDLVVAEVEDAGYSGATNAWSLKVIAGTPAGSPSAPATPDNAIVLARVAVAANVTTIVDANITDMRPVLKAAYRVGGTDVAIADGGTGASTVAAARSNLKVVETQQGQVTVSFTSGIGSITFGYTFPGIAPANVVASINDDSTWDSSLKVRSTSTSGASLLCYVSGALHTGSLDVNWIAMQTPSEI